MKAVVAAFNQEKALVGAFSVITNLRMELFQALVGAFNQEKALEGAFSVIVQPVVKPMGRYAALHRTLDLPITAVSPRPCVPVLERSGAPQPAVPRPSALRAAQ